MYETEDLILLQMQKAGSTHIAKILAHVFKGHPPNEGEGKHSRATEAQINSGKKIISSIRSPWDWYVSLWTFGCCGKGGLRHRLANCKEDGKRAGASKWDDVYADKSDVTRFREWLRMIYACENRHLTGKDHGDGSIEPDYGFMTCRYIRLCWKNLQFERHISNESHPDSLMHQDKDQCYVNHFVRIESLEEELCRVINMIRPLTTEEQRFIHAAGRTNCSGRAHPLHKYYNRETIDMVHHYDNLLIRKFAYSETRWSRNTS
jgi:hypothetical protein